MLVKPIFIFGSMALCLKGFFIRTFFTSPSLEGFGTVTLEFVLPFQLTLPIVEARVWVASALERQHFKTDM